ncbi:MAG TPA: cation transporter [Gemmatimonadaceae bacterium]|nr:cation transporter [Gemmatimonadaceae bacterium]
MDTLNLTIDGMSCDHCVVAVRKALASVPGVRIERVDVGSATVAYDPQRATPDEIIDVVNDEGYMAQRSATAG